MSSKAPLATIQKEQRTLAGHEHFYKYEGIPFIEFMKESAWAAMKSKPYFYVIQVDSCEPHSTIKIGISDNKSPHSRLFEYAKFYNFSFKIVMILTFYQWKKDIPEGVQKGKKPLQERFEDKLKQEMKLNKKAKKLNVRGNEWVDLADKDKILSLIQSIRTDPTFTSIVPTTKIPLHHAPTIKYSGVDETSKIAATGNLPLNTDHQERIKKIHGKTVGRALGTRFKNNKGDMATYSNADLKYDIDKGYITVT